MENFINYYYGINVENIYFDNKKYIFYYDNCEYNLKSCNNTDLDVYYNLLSKELRKYDCFSEIIINVNNNYITFVDNKPYILLKVISKQNRVINYLDISTNMFINYNNNLVRLVRFPWIKLWEQKIDYFENIFFSNKNKYKKIYPLFFYFVGVAENTILYLKNTNNEEKKELIDNLVVAHERLSINCDKYDYYDPSNIIFDHSSRDISEYLKSSFINNKFDINILENYLLNYQFSRYGLRMIYARLLFPSFFFDYLDSMLLNDNEIDLLYLEARIKEFYSFIQDITQFFHTKYNIPIINWIIKEI